MKHLTVIAMVGGLLACTQGLPPDLAPPVDVGSTPIAPVTYDAVYVVDGESATISVIDAEKNVRAGVIALRGIAYPHHVSLSPDRSRLALAVPGYDMSMGEFGHAMHSSRQGEVLLLDAVTGALEGWTKTDAANNNVAFAPDGVHLWTSQATSPGSTIVLDAASLELRDAITVGTSPAETVLSPDGAFAFVANSGSSSVSVIDVAGRRVRATIQVEDGPVLAVPSPLGFVYVENEPSRSITIIDQKTFTVKKTFELGYVPGSLSVASNGEVWTTSPNGGFVEARDPDGNVLRSVSTGNGAHWVVFSPDGARIYVSNEWANTVSVIDHDSMSVIATIPVGAKPNGMVWRSK